MSGKIEVKKLTFEEKRDLYRRIYERAGITRTHESREKNQPEREEASHPAKEIRSKSTEKPEVRKDEKEPKPPAKKIPRRVRFKLISAKELIRRKDNQDKRESDYLKAIGFDPLKKVNPEEEEMSQLSSKFRALKQVDYEKGDSLFTKPLIRFYPNASRMASAKRNTIELGVNPGDDLNTNTFKISYAVFEAGTIEDLIEWQRTLKDIIEKKPLPGPKARFLMTRSMLSGQAKEKFDAMSAQVCEKLVTNAEGVEQPAGETLNTFDESLRAFVRSYFKPVCDSLLTQREYLQHCIKFPVNRELDFREFLIGYPL